MSEFETETTTVVHFSIDGDWLTDHVRELWENGRGDHALKTLECLPGITAGQCADILEGRAKLTGNSANGLEFEPDDYKGLTTKDLLKKQLQRIEELEDRDADMTEMAIGETVIVGSHEGPRRVPRRKTKPNNVGMRVLKDNLEFDDFPNPDSKFKKLSVYSEAEEFRNLGSELETTDVPELEDEEEPERPKPPPPSALTEVTSDTGWISPEGFFYPCKYGKHAETLWLLGVGESTYYVEAPEWVKMCVTSYGKKETQNFWGERSLWTEKQMQMINDWVKKTGCQAPFWLQDEEMDSLEEK